MSLVSAMLFGLGCVREDAIGSVGPGSTLYAGGSFTDADGIPANHIASWNPDADAWSAPGEGTNADVYAMVAFDDGTGDALYVGGAFSTVGGAPALNVARWSPDTQTWTALGSGFNNSVYALAVYDDGSGPSLFAGGIFNRSGSDSVECIARWEPQSARWRPLGPGLDNWVGALAVVDEGARSALYAGGGFTCTFGGAVCSSGVMRWDGVTWSGVGPGGGLDGTNHVVNSLAALDDGDGEDLYVGGGFTGTRDGTPDTNYTAKWDPRARLWSTVGRGVNEFVFALYALRGEDGPELYVGGAFTGTRDDTPGTAHVAKWDVRTERWESLDGGADDRVLAFACLDDGHGKNLYLGGMFTQLGGVATNRVGRWVMTDSDPYCDSQFGIPGIQATVYALSTLPTREFDPPRIDDMAPAAGSACGGTLVTISGDNFCSPCTVTIGGARATGVTVVDPRTITAITPPGTDGDVVDVTVDTGVPPSATMAGAFLYEDPGVPTIDSVLPNTGPLNGGTAVTIRGSRFCIGTTVLFGSASASSVRFVSPQELVATSPAQLTECIDESVVAITVENPTGDVASMDPGFSYVYGRRLFVDGDNPNCPGDGSMENPFCRIQEAIDAAEAGDAILVEPDIESLSYDEALDTRGKSILVTSAAPPFKPVVRSPGPRVLTVNSGEGRDTVVACLELISSGNQGGILVDAGSSPTIYNNRIHDHQIAGDGAGILVTGGSSPLIRGNSLDKNCAAGSGGAIAVVGAGSAPLLVRNVVASNDAGGNGGGIAVLGAGAAPEISENDVKHNTAGGDGGGIYVATGTKVARVSGHSPAASGYRNGGIRGNRAGGHGGGIYCGADLDANMNARVTRQLLDNDIYDNEAFGMGGGIFVEGGGRAVVSRNRIHDNNKDHSGEVPPKYHDNGGGVACDGTTASGTDLTLRENHIENNRSDKFGSLGGGIYVKGARTVLVKATLEGNFVCGNRSEAGSGIALDTKVFPATLRRNVVAFNIAQETPGRDEGDDPPNIRAPGILEIDSHLILENNTCHRNTGGDRYPFGGGLHCDTGLFGNSRIVNNVFSENSGCGLYMFVAIVPPTTYNTLFANERDGTDSNCSAWDTVGSRNVFGVDPAYVNANRCDRLQLREGSPCIDGGDPAVTPPPDGGIAIDRGAVEFTERVGARYGNVNGGAGCGDIEDVLKLNGAAGDVDREIVIGVNQPLTLTMDAPPSRRLPGQTSAFVLYAWAGENSAAVEQPFDLGKTVFPTPLSGGSPVPRYVWNNSDPRFGTADLPSRPAPSTVFNRAAGIGKPITLMFQGFIRDDCASSGRGFSTTNAVLLRVIE